MANDKSNQFSFQKFEETDDPIQDSTNQSPVLITKNSIILQNLLIQYTSQGLLSFITAPLNTVYTTLQMTNKFPSNLTNHQFSQKALNKIKDKNKKIEYKRYSELNLFGHNRPSFKQNFEGYSDCFKKLSREGLKGLFKGNLVGFTYQFIQNMLKIQLHKLLFSHEAQSYDGVSYIQLFIKSFIVNTMIDILIQPIHTYQSRLIYQDSRKHLRIYSSFYQYFKEQTKNKTLFRAWKSNIPINIFYATNVHPYMQQSPERLLQGLGIISFLTYPFITIQRRLEIQSNYTKSLNQDNYQGYFDAIRQIYQKEGLKQFYRGFIGFSIVKIYQSLIFYYVTKQNIVDLI